jgi:hypothetical protein
VVSDFKSTPFSIAGHSRNFIWMFELEIRSSIRSII